MITDRRFRPPAWRNAGRLLSLWVALGLFAASPAPAADAPAMMDKGASGVPLSGEHDPKLCAPDGIGAGGLDLVTYREPLGPRPGQAEFAAEHDGLTYLFVSAEHRQRFLDDPDFYLPRYSGWCAITLALGRLTCPDYENFKIEHDRLLLFEVTGFTNGRTVWETDPLNFRRQADANYERLMTTP
jgi:YHS domain-containing protein